MRRVPLVVLLILLALAVAPAPAYAGGIVSVCDEAHLLAALAGGGTVSFSCSGTITLTATITISSDTTIDGTGHNVTISGNHAVGVFHAKQGVITLNRLTVADGSAGYGGGISNSGNITLTVTNSTFSGNSASYGGGAIAIGGGSRLTVSNSTFSGNSAGRGGGIDNEYGTLTVSNSTFAGNSAADLGGGIYNYYGTLTVSNSTFSGNSASEGGGIRSYNSPATFKNTLVANSPAGGNCYNDPQVSDGGGNLSYPDNTCPGINGNPMLGPLQDNGGPTQTLALGGGSAARDAANDAICAAAPVNNRDQRGITRPQGPHCDIGAYEATPPRTFLPMVIR